MRNLKTDYKESVTTLITLKKDYKCERLLECETLYVSLGKYPVINISTGFF